MLNQKDILQTQDMIDKRDLDIRAQREDIFNAMHRI